MDASLGKLLAEVLLLHRWAGGNQVSLARMYGLANGVESVLERTTPRTISAETQRKIEGMLDDVDKGRQDPDGTAVKDRLREDDISEEDAEVIMRLCVLQDRFGDAVKRIADADDSGFSSVLDAPSTNNEWHGALHYLELFDESKNTSLMHTFSPCVPRIGETVEAHKGSLMKVVDVRHCLQPVKDPLGGSYQQRVLVPVVHLQPIDGTEE